MKINKRAVVAIDCESHLFRRGLGLPPMVCLSIYAEHKKARRAVEHATRRFDKDRAQLLSGKASSGGKWWLLHHHAARECYPELVEDDGLHLAAHNAPFDVGLMAHESGTVEAAFERFERGSVSDTLIRERLAAIAAGHLDFDPDLRMKSPRHSLAQVVKKRLKVDIGDDKMRPPKGHKGDLWPWVCAKLKCPDCNLPPWLGVGRPKDSGRKCKTCDGYGLTGPWRLRYCQLHGVPLHHWPERAISYAVDDSMWTHLALEAQLDVPVPDTGIPIVESSGLFIDEVNQTRSWWALSLMAVWGVRTEPHRVKHVIADWTKRAEMAIKVGQEAGFVRKDGSENRAEMAALVVAAYTKKGATVPRGDPTANMLKKADALAEELKALKKAGAPKSERKAMKVQIAELRAGNVKYDDTTLKESGDQRLIDYAENKVYRSNLSKYADTLEIGTTCPITSNPNPLVVTGRTGWSNPPLQQPPKKGGYRESHVPRDGWVFAAADYDTIEICSLAQQHIDWGLGSTIRDRIAAGIDLHTDLASDAFGIPYKKLLKRVAEGDPEAERMRFQCKAGNFGFMGLMGPKACVDAYGVKTFSENDDLDEAIENARALRKVWLEKTPEMTEYFDIVLKMISTGTAIAIQSPSGRQRLCFKPTQLANTYFQGRTSDGAKLGTWKLAQACYVPGVDPALYGARPWLLLHDELFTSFLRSRVQVGAPAMASTLRVAMEEVTPDVPIGIESSIMRRWYKGAKPVKVSGLLLPWEPWKRLRADSKIYDEDGERDHGAMWAWESLNEREGRAVAFADGSWAAFDKKDCIGRGKVSGVKHRELLALARHHAESCVLGEEPWL